MARYKITVTELTPRGRVTNMAGETTRLWDTTGEHVQHVNAKNKDEAEAKLAAKIETQFKDDCVYVMDIQTDNLKGKSDEDRGVLEPAQKVVQRKVQGKGGKAPAKSVGTKRKTGSAGGRKAKGTA